MILPKNDDARAFFIENGYPQQYNDGLVAYLRDILQVSNYTLPDLLRMYRDTFGEDLDTLFSPTELFSSSEKGVWYDPSDITTLFQDAAGTIPVVSHGDPVGRVEDKSGNGHHLTQTTDANRPTYHIGSTGAKSLLFDGTNDSLVNGTLDLTTTNVTSIFTSFQKLTQAAAGTLFVHGANFTTAGSFELLAPTGANTTTLLGGMSTAGSTNFIAVSRNDSPPIKLTFAGIIDYSEAAGSEIQFRINRVSTAQNGGVTQENTGTFGNSTLRVGGRTASTVHFNGNLYGLILRGATSSTNEVLKAETYINKKKG